MTRGGARKGAGRKVIYCDDRVIVTVKLDADLVRWLDESLDSPDAPALSRTHLIAGVLRCYRDEIESARTKRG